MPKNKKLHILMLEDNPADADLNAEQLTDAGMSFEYRRVETEQDYLKELREFDPDIILADYRLPRFDGLAALRLARERYHFIPFILVSGVLEEEAAVELFKSGASDYIRKGSTARLGTAVKNALALRAAQEEKAHAEAELRKSYQELERRVEERTRQLARANEAEKESAQRFQRIFSSNISGVAIADFQGTVFEANDYYLGLLEYTREEFEQRKIRWQEMTPSEYLPLDYKAMEELKERGVCTPYEKEYLTKSGKRKWVNISDIVLPGDTPKIVAIVIDISARKKAERALQESRQDLNRAQAVAHIGSWRLNIGRNELVWSDEAYSIFGVSLGTSMTYEAFLSYVHPDDLAYVNGEWQEALKGKPYDIEHRIIVGDTVKWVREKAELEFDRHGALQGGFGIVQDITERKKTEEAVRNSEATLNAFFENSPVSLAIRNEELQYIKIDSHTARDYYGIEPERMVGKKPGELNPEMAETIDPIAHQVIEKGKTVQFEQNPYFPATRRKVNLMTVYFPVPLGNGRRGLGTVAVDITDRKKSEDILRRNEYELRTLVDNSPDLIFRLNQRMQYVYANPAYERLTGILKEQFIGKTNSELGMPQQLAEFWQTTARDTIESGQERSVEFDMMSFFGKRYFFARLIPEFDKSGLVETVLVIARDITERRRAEEQIRYISFHDEVTGLFNRAFFEEEIRRVDTERDLPISIIMGDVNNLKLTNDVFGHNEGDRLLKAIANSIRKACRQSDIVARWGGDEFAVILPKTDFATADEIRSRIGQIAAEDASTILQPSIAVGIATKEHRDRNIYQTIRVAEEKMYDHKLAHARENQDLVMSCLLEQIRKRFPGIDDHVNRSIERARRFGRELGLPADQINDLELLIQLHDIGDAVIPAEILLKPGPLSEEEWQVVRKHSEAGFRIVKTFADTARISDEVLSHGERWDGSGYPRGLKGTEIPYLARIFPIVDVFDVITHKRPYAKALASGEAVEELRRNAGTQFDPGLTEIFLARVALPAEKAGV